MTTLRGFAFMMAVALVPQLAFGDLPGPAPTIGEIVTECVEEYPTPRSRTTIGIGELVNLSIDPDSWVDPDIPIGSGNPYDYDELSEITWTANGDGTVYPTVGASTQLVADLCSLNGSVTVEASAEDAGLGDDPPVIKQANFSLEIPSGENVIGCIHGPFGAGNTHVGMRTNFAIQIAPATVNFSRVKFREDREAVDVTFPDGVTNIKQPQAFIPPMGGNVSTQAGLPNIHGDLLGDAPNPKAALLKAGMWANFNWERKVDQQFQDKNGMWNKFHSVVHKREYDASNLKARTGIDGTEWGGWMGPFGAQ
ncbi:MAG: hypothetical protein WCJ09_12615 [Planctomycetota bacterium]